MAGGRGVQRGTSVVLECHAVRRAGWPPLPRPSATAEAGDSNRPAQEAAMAPKLASERQRRLAAAGASCQVFRGEARARTTLSRSPLALSAHSCLHLAACQMTCSREATKPLRAVLIVRLFWVNAFSANPGPPT